MTKGTRAFTLLEMLVVIAVIGVLVALLLPALTRSQKRAQQVRCASNLHQIGLGLQVFVADNHTYPTFLSPTNSEHSGLWFAQLAREGLGAQPKTNWLTEGVWRCPSAQFKDDLLSIASNSKPVWQSHISYGYNAFGLRGNATNSLGLSGNLVLNGWASINESAVVAPSDMMAIGDAMNGDPQFRRFSTYPTKGSFSLVRHQGRLNVVFCDGHVDSPNLEFLEANTNDVALSPWNRDHQPHRNRL